ncbi:MAG: Hpt domain-containing protein [Nitrospira sp.]|nr:MAG: Hpt domain-containing protein [Nitrospira sp.]
MSADDAFNLAEALTHVDEDEELFRTLVEIFVEQAPVDMAATQAAVDAGDAEAVARTAHRLKGAIMQFSAPRAFDASKELEALGRAGTLDRAATVCVDVNRELQRLLAALRAYLANGSAA